MRLTNTTDVETWRREKEQSDKGRTVEDILGCVGEPIREWLAKHVDCEDPTLIEACEQARENLVGFVRDIAETEVENALNEASEYLELDPYELDLEPSDTLGDVAEKGFDIAKNAIYNYHYTVDIDPENL